MGLLEAPTLSWTLLSGLKKSLGGGFRHSIAWGLASGGSTETSWTETETCESPVYSHRHGLFWVNRDTEREPPKVSPVCSDLDLSRAFPLRRTPKRPQVRPSSKGAAASGRVSLAVVCWGT